MTLPVVARPGETGALTVEGAYEGYHAIAGPSWRNEIDASFTTELGSFRPTKDAKRVTAPTLVQIADFDRSAPPHAAAKAAFKARAEVRHYPCDHFDVYPGAEWHDAGGRPPGRVPDPAPPPQGLSTRGHTDERHRAEDAAAPTPSRTPRG